MIRKAASDKGGIGIKRLFYPNLSVNRPTEIPLEILSARNIQGIIFDLDNTIIAWGQGEMELEIVAWLRMLKERGFKLCIVSNSMTERVRRVAGFLDIPYAARAGKPLRGGFLRALKLLSLQGEQVAVVGDQRFTDVLGGNRIGAFTILVKPLDEREFFTTKLTRALERLFFADKKD